MLSTEVWVKTLFFFLIALKKLFKKKILKKCWQAWMNTLTPHMQLAKDPDWTL